LRDHRRRPSFAARASAGDRLSEKPSSPHTGLLIHRRGWCLSGGLGTRAVELIAGDCGGSPSRHRVRKKPGLGVSGLGFRVVDTWAQRARQSLGRAVCLNLRRWPHVLSSIRRSRS
jgi:hypothetical protein